MRDARMDAQTDTGYIAASPIGHPAAMSFQTALLLSMLDEIDYGFIVLWPPAPDIVLRVVPPSNLPILNPIWTTQYIGRNHGYTIYDTLFGTDEKGQVRPRTVAVLASTLAHQMKNA